MTSISRPASNWWLAIRGAKRRRIAYEAALAAGLAGITAFMAADTWFDLPPGPRIALTVTVSLLTLAAVPLRRSRPITALLLAALTEFTGAGLALFVVSFAVGYRYRQIRRSAVLLGFGFTAVACMVGAHLGEDGSATFNALAGLMYFLVAGVLPGTLAAVLAQRRLLVMSMNQRNIELHEQQQVVAGQAQARERTRIAAELHDSLGHRLTLISLYAGGLAQAATPSPSTEKARAQAVGLLRDTSAQAMGELRQILKVLHQDGPAEAGRSLDEVEPTIAAARQTGTEIELVRSGDPRPLPILAEHAAYRVVQEGITNALKHARGAPIRVEVHYTEDAVHVSVRNRPGLPYQGQSTGQGLHGLAERVRLAGGVLSSGSLEDGDFRLGGVLPYEAEVPEPVTLPPSDFQHRIRRTSRWQRLGAVGIVLTTAIALAALIGAITEIETLDSTDQGVYNFAETGDDFQRLKLLLPQPLSTETRADGQVCRIYTGGAEDTPLTLSTEVNYEFCFRDDVLVSKQKVEMRTQLQITDGT
ncbi:sensor histidine kinase [Kineosporia babensis]|uniref:histidine kinase n=1 Tax=Kineosporia babensis TaxID=499548 RepID=A0A9X1SXI9_9ACTN|nr:histidine kinase [Kineosporia babensis]MCD5310273.1 histidine kinase [Kineosporia babensis]